MLTFINSKINNIIETLAAWIVPGTQLTLKKIHLMNKGNKQQQQQQHQKQRKQKNFLKVIDLRDFSGGPVAKNPCSQYSGPGFNPWSGNKTSHASTKSSHAAPTKRSHMPKGRPSAAT